MQSLSQERFELISRLCDAVQKAGVDWSSREARLAGLALSNATADAIEAFAVERGWSRARQNFTLPQLAAGRPGRNFTADYLWSPSKVLAKGANLAWDHPNFFREKRRPYRPAGIVVHVYSVDPDPGYRYADQLAALYGLTFVPLPWSWYNPAACLAGVYTRVSS